MDNQPENKSIQLDTDYENHAINMKFSNNLTDDRERGYILSAAFFSYCASQGLDKHTKIGRSSCTSILIGKKASLNGSVIIV